MKNVRRLTEGAILLAAFTVLLLITVYVPLLAVVVNLFLPVPFILFAAKNEWKFTFVFFIASMLISVIAGAMIALPLTILYGITGGVIGYLLQKNKSRTVIFLLSSLTFLILVVAQYAVSVAFFKVNVIQDSIKMLHDSLNQSSSMMKNLGQEKASKKSIDQMKEAIDLAPTIIPSIFVMSSFFMVFLIQAVSMPIVRRFGIKVEKWKPFRDILLPKSLLWYYLITMIVSMLTHPVKGSYLFMVLINLTYILQLFMMIQGISFVFYFFHRRGTPKAIPVIITVFSFIMPIFMNIVRILGIIDLGFDLRKRLENKK
ncbi:MAG: YybS family protein [Bacillota bacterium]|nr:YybS family protein [Bacillota bacterium]